MVVKEAWKCYGENGLDPHADFTELHEVIQHLLDNQTHQVYLYLRATNG